MDPLYDKLNPQIKWKVVLPAIAVIITLITTLVNAIQSKPPTAEELNQLWEAQLPEDHALIQSGAVDIQEKIAELTDQSKYAFDTGITITKYQLSKHDPTGLIADSAFDIALEGAKPEFRLTKQNESTNLTEITIKVGDTFNFDLFRNGAALSFETEQLHEIPNYQMSLIIQTSSNDTNIATIYEDTVFGVSKGSTTLNISYGMEYIELPITVVE